MSLYEQWNDIFENSTPEQVQAFFEVYYEKERDAYAEILGAKENKISGTMAELAEKFKFEQVEMLGFVDGINTSLEKSIELESLEADTKVELNINWEKLYFNMHKANANWLYSLEQWDDILSLEKREEIEKEYKESLQVHVEHIGRNDPCPCGSGKKYKKCCGKDA
ncbi:MAG: SEC-C domain-containing protein [Ruminococcaceae bacterium]|nr:SEC-C domain-containing protein [Oscillospiraceae bacterium]